LTSWIAIALGDDPIRGDREMVVQYDMVVGDEIDMMLKNSRVVYEIFGRVQSSFTIEESVIRRNVQIFERFVYA
jgi:hypothetical protein